MPRKLPLVLSTVAMWIAIAVFVAYFCAAAYMRQDWGPLMPVAMALAGGVVGTWMIWKPL